MESWSSVTVLLFTAGCEAQDAGTQTETPDTNMGYAVNDDFTYTCSEGYEYLPSDGGLTVTCNAGSPPAWSANGPECTGKIVILSINNFPSNQEMFIACVAITVNKVVN